MWNCHKTETVGKLAKTVWSNDTDSYVTSTSLLFNGKILKHLVTEMKLKENWCANCRLYSQMFLGANSIQNTHVPEDIQFCIIKMTDRNSHHWICQIPD